jgi:hypothetical protein
MKMVKRLLLGSAAGLVAVSAGQAADLPVKAKPVEYVKICTLYGAGFYYMPGTDICLKIGGYVRAETTYHSNGNFAAGPTSGEVFNRTSNEFVMRARAYITADAREQTAWGTARAYVAVGVATTDTGATVSPSILGFNRAFIQWAGITAGITQSFYDFYSGAATGYRAYLPTEDTGDSGWWVWAYTAQLGNGLSASISAEQRRATQIIGLTGAFTGTAQVALVDQYVSGGGTVAAVATTNTAGYGGIQSPDIVANIRVDQTWGSAQIMGAAHEVNAAYYGCANVVSGNSGTLVNCNLIGAPPGVVAGGNNSLPGSNGNGLSTTGHPGDEWGYVVGAGLRLNFPMIAQGDFFQGEVNYTHGALRYLMMGDNGPNFGIERGGKFGYGVVADCVYGSDLAPVAGPVVNPTGCNLTTAWSLNVAYEHYWTPQFHESFLGGYLAVKYGSQANAILCNQEGDGTPAGHAGSDAVANAGCNNNFNLWSAGTRLQYDFTKTLYFGVEFLYQHLDTATQSGGVLHNTQLNPPSNDLFTVANTGRTPTTISDMNVLSVTARIHKDFLP